MRREPEALSGVKIVTAKSFADERGSLLQSWLKSDLTLAGIPPVFEQAIQTRSKRGVLRGLHFQWAPPMGKYVRCVRGAVLDVVVDIRHNSPTLADHAAVELTDRNHRVIWVPPGFAHAIFALEDDTIVLYECTAEYEPGGEGGIRWDDPNLGIAWPATDPILSEKDRNAPTLAEWLADPRSKRLSFP